MVANDYEREICDGVLCGLSLLLVLALSWPCCEGFPLGTPGPPPQKKPVFRNSSWIWNGRSRTTS